MNLTPEEARTILLANGIDTTIEEAVTVLNFLNKIEHRRETEHLLENNVENE